MRLMQIANNETHRALAYLVATGRYGKPITVDLFDAYAHAPDPADAEYRTTGSLAYLMNQSLASFAAFNGMQELVHPAEKASAYLERVGWAEIVSGSIFPTALGSAVLQALNAPTVDVSNEDPITVVIDPDDPLAYAKVFGLIVSQDTGLLVDPYLGISQLFELLEVQAVTRILMSDKDLRVKRPVIAKALAAVEGRVKVRYIGEKQLHDRFFIPDTGDVLVFGSSLNSLTRRPGVVTPLADSTASSAIRDAYGKLWISGTAIAPSDVPGGSSE